MKTCLIKRNFRAFTAYNENGNRICSRILWENLVRELTFLGYEIVPSNSRAGKTILDKVEGHVI